MASERSRDRFGTYRCQIGHKKRFEDSVLEVIGQIPAGELMTYGEVAEEAGFPGAARAVGNLLRTTAADVPWWRVVASGGRITSPGGHEQAARLRAEGHEVVGRSLRPRR